MIEGKDEREEVEMKGDIQSNRYGKTAEERQKTEGGERHRNIVREHQEQPRPFSISEHITLPL